MKNEELIRFYDLFQSILAFPRHNDCELCFGEGGSGRVSHPIYSESTLDLYYEESCECVYIEWETPEEGISLLEEYIREYPKQQALKEGAN